jgi:hypothetical protein
LILLDDSLEHFDVYRELEDAMTARLFANALPEGWIVS